MTASVVGILAMAAKITGSLVEVVRKERAAPTSAQRIINEVSDLSLCLTRLKPFVDGIQSASEARRAAIAVDDVIILTTSCVTNLDDLDKILDSYQLHLPLSIARRTRWLKEEKKIDELVNRLQASKTSLNLMLTILTGYVLVRTRHPTSRRIEIN